MTTTKQASPTRAQRQIIRDVFSQLDAHFGPLHWWQDHKPFEVMVGAILVQNTAWTNVEKALKNLGDELNPLSITNMPEPELAEKIRPSGYYNQKAKKLKSLVQWYCKYNFQIEQVRKEEASLLRQELLDINGVGNETADAILVYAIKKPSFVVDAYTRRIFSRYGLDVPTKYQDFQSLLESTFAKDLDVYAQYHGLMVEHAQQYCKKIPQCSGCPLEEKCVQKEITK
ncbi:endonuclease III domain-containing protein [Vibrio sp. HN007]|uniref:endonuclease III domain-containing protein n=1 Tax=Vibrio iocasae TaxID=3098914 RepID=UPI0035D4A3F9